MKNLVLIALLISTFACGGGSNNKKKSNQLNIEREQLQGEQKITPEEAANELKINYSNQLNELYINQSYEVKSARAQSVMNTNGREVIACPINSYEKYTVIDFNETTVNLYVERKENTDKEECKKYLTNGKIVEVHQRKNLFDLDFSKNEIKDFDIYRGFRNGQVLFSMSGTTTIKGATVKLAALFNPNVSNLYANESLKTMTSFNGELFHAENTSRQKILDIPADKIDLNGVQTVHVTYEKN